LGIHNGDFRTKKQGLSLPAALCFNKTTKPKSIYREQKFSFGRCQALKSL
jgi:hypothetical protein